MPGQNVAAAALENLNIIADLINGILYIIFYCEHTLCATALKILSVLHGVWFKTFETYFRLCTSARLRADDEELRKIRHEKKRKSAQHTSHKLLCVTCSSTAHALPSHFLVTWLFQFSTGFGPLSSYSIVIKSPSGDFSSQVSLQLHLSFSFFSFLPRVKPLSLSLPPVLLFPPRAVPASLLSIKVELYRCQRSARRWEWVLKTVSLCLGFIVSPEGRRVTTCHRHTGRPIHSTQGHILQVHTASTLYVCVCMRACAWVCVDFLSLHFHVHQCLPVFASSLK